MKKHNIFSFIHYLYWYCSSILTHNQRPYALFSAPLVEVVSNTINNAVAQREIANVIGH